MSEDTKAAMQQRVDRIRIFRDELAALERDQVLVLSEDQQAATRDYHDSLLQLLAETYDVDTTDAQKKLSLGMQVASLLGALALAISVFFLFFQYWGAFSTIQQIGILLTAPLLMLVCCVVVADREATGYFAKVLALITFACFVLNISVLGRIYNITPSDGAFFVWGVLAFLLAYCCNVRLLLVAGIVCIGGLLAARVGAWSGIYWVDFGARPENFLPVAVLLFALPFVLASFHRGFTGFTGFLAIYRVFGLIAFFVPVLILSYWGSASYLTISNDVVEVLYQVIGFAVSAALIAVGVKRGLNDVVNTANTFFILFLYTKIYSWWWDLMPKYLFFLLVGLVALLLLFVFKRLRSTTWGEPQSVPS
ncbi:MAG: DUF2157 domain-containing protein [Pseudomonadota bacterium]